MTSTLFALPVALTLAAPAAEPPRHSTTLDVGGPLAIGLTINTWSGFLEHQTAVNERFSAILEVSYLTSENVRKLGGDLTGLRMRLGILCLGAAYWFRRPFDGPFVSVRVEGWLSAAQDGQGRSVIGNQFDANLQPGWQWQIGRFTVIGSLSFAYVTGPLRSADGAVEFPLSGFSGTPHVRVGYLW